MLFTFCQKQLVWFLKLKIPFRGEKLTVFNAFPVLLALHQQDTRIFSRLLNLDYNLVPRSLVDEAGFVHKRSGNEIILIGQFKFPARQPYARCMMFFSSVPKAWYKLEARRRVFSFFLECSQMTGVFYHSAIHGLGFIWLHLL